MRRSGQKVRLLNREVCERVQFYNLACHFPSYVHRDTGEIIVTGTKKISRNKALSLRKVHARRDMALSIELKRLKFPGNVVEAAVIGESHYEGVDCTTTSLSCHLTATSAPLHGTVCILLNKKRFDVGSVILKYHRKQDYWISDMYCRYIFFYIESIFLF